METYDNERLEEVRKFFSMDRFATENGAVIEAIGKDYAKVSLKLTHRHRNAVGGIMGGVYFTLADFAFAVATNHEETGTVSLSSDISFIGTPKSERIYAETELIKNGRRVCTYNVRVTDKLGTPLAAVKTVGIRRA